MYDVRGSDAWDTSLLKSRSNQDFDSRGGGVVRGAADAPLGAITIDFPPELESLAATWRGASTTAPVETTATERTVLGDERCLAPAAAGRVRLLSPAGSMTFVPVDRAFRDTGGAGTRFGARSGGSANAGASANVGGSELVDASIFLDVPAR
ncbi:MAG: hypothetical protein JJD97_13575 [Gemmatimonadaceae bacterium]|nr:hypothetical protein [Gemmatimonadaceae bacterium]